VTRDSQKARVYKCDARLPKTPVFPSLAAVEEFYKTITSSKWWEYHAHPRRQFPNGIRVERGRLGAGRAYTGSALVTLGTQAQDMSSVLHELAHMMSGPGAHHGPEFVQNFQKLIRRWWSREVADQYKRDCKELKVRSSRKSPPGAAMVRRAVVRDPKETEASMEDEIEAAHADQVKPT